MKSHAQGSRSASLGVPVQLREERPSKPQRTSVSPTPLAFRGPPRPAQVAGRRKHLRGEGLGAGPPRAKGAHHAQRPPDNPECYKQLREKSSTSEPRASATRTTQLHHPVQLCLQSRICPKLTLHFVPRKNLSSFRLLHVQFFFKWLIISQDN